MTDDICRARAMNTFRPNASGYSCSLEAGHAPLDGSVNDYPLHWDEEACTEFVADPDQDPADDTFHYGIVNGRLRNHPGRRELCGECPERDPQVFGVLCDEDTAGESEPSGLGMYVYIEGDSEALDDDDDDDEIEDEPTCDETFDNPDGAFHRCTDLQRWHAEDVSDGFSIMHYDHITGRAWYDGADKLQPRLGRRSLFRKFVRLVVSIDIRSFFLGGVLTLAAVAVGILVALLTL